MNALRLLGHPAPEIGVVATMRGRLEGLACGVCSRPARPTHFRKRSPHDERISRYHRLRNPD